LSSTVSAAAEVAARNETKNPHKTFFILQISIVSTQNESLKDQTS